MNHEPSIGSVVFALMSLSCLCIAFYLWLITSQNRRKIHRLMSSLPGCDENQSFDICLKKFSDQFEMTRERNRHLRTGFFYLSEQLSLAAALYDPKAETVEYNQSFAQLTGLTKRAARSLHALELPLFGDLFREPSAEARLVKMGNLKLKVHRHISSGFVMAFFENISQQEQEMADRKYFSNTLWHEIKTPVTVMKGFTNILLEEIHDPFLLKATSTIDKQISRIESLIGNLRTLTGYQEKGEALCTQQDIIDILSRLVDSWQDEATRQKITLSINLDTLVDTDFILQFTRGDLFVLVSNLISNAVKFTQENGTVTIVASCTQNDLMLEVTDTGPGIPPQYQAILYSPLGYDFLEGKESRGMGLYLIKEAVERGQGRIVFKSDEKGTAYRLIFPLLND